MHSKPKLGEEIDLLIDNLGINGEGVGKQEGFTLFVEGALPGEKIRCCVSEVRSNFARAHLQQILTPSSDRIEPACPLFGKCGGCQIMHLDYAQQLKAKQKRVVDALQRIAKIEVDVKDCIASPEPLGYRNKIQLPVNQANRLGLYARNTHTIVEIEGCLIHCPLGGRALEVVQDVLKMTPILPGLKYVLIKTAVNTKQVLVILVTQDQTPLTELAKQIKSQMEEIKGVVQNVNPSEKNVVLGKECIVLEGQGWIEERLCGLYFKVSPASFFQVNPAQAEALYQHVFDVAGLTGAETVLDAYCGVGTLSLFCAKGAKEVIGIECVEEAILDAIENARRNGIENVQFICGRAEEKIGLLEKMDVAILNPPRKGCEISLLKAVVERKPERIIYVSCDPATLSRDIYYLDQQGYHLGSVQPFDMFPQTMHVECVAVLERRR